ncbi:MAG: spore germination protein GerW family protein [Methanobacteriota archaeon]
MTTEDLIKEVTGNLKDLINAQSVIGAPIDLGNKIIIPVTKFGLGFGAGGCKGSDGDGSGAGGGGGIEPVAVIISHKDIQGAEGVQIFSLKKDNPIAQVITALGESLVPQVIDLIKGKEAMKPADPKKPEDPATS